MSKTPKLRFKEFSGDWESKKFKDIIKETRLGGNYVNTENKTNYPLIKMGNISRGKIDLSKIEYIPEVEIIDENDKLKHGDLLFNTRNTLDLVGKVSVWKNELNLAYYNSNLMKLTFDEKFIDNNYFMNYLFNTRTVLSRLKAIATGTTSVAAIYTRDLQNIKLEFPCLEEQEKIASFFSLIDDKISLQGEKVEALKDYKKGMMQKIFSRELRFKDDEGRDYPEWNHKKLSSIVERVTRKNKGTQSTLPLTISAQYGLVDQITFFNKTVASSNLEGYYLLEKGEFAYNKSYSTGYPFGAIKRLDRYDKGVLSSLYICFSILKNIDSDFLVQYFETSCWHKEISMIAVEGARNHGLLNISVSDFFETYHWIPCYEEQVKIGKFLNKIDKKINKEQEKLDSLNEHKKGLLQQMFV